MGFLHSQIQVPDHIVSAPGGSTAVGDGPGSHGHARAQDIQETVALAEYLGLRFY